MRLIFNYLLLACMTVLLSACASTPQSVKSDGYPNNWESIDVSHIPNAIPKNESRSQSGNPDSYVVFGKRYKVRNSAVGYKKTGIASWYGTYFNGRKTASGEPYDMMAMTAAHKTLPIPSYVKVTNVQNNKSVIVRVNDRGPFHGNRIIDLSFTAAKKLGIVKLGSGRVRVEAITPSVPHKPKKVTYKRTHKSQAQMFVQVGAYSNENTADKVMAKVEKLTHYAVNILTEQSIYKVQIGPIATTSALNRVINAVKNAGFKHPMKFIK